MIYSDGGETGFVERMVIESIEEGIRGRCRSVFFFFQVHILISVKVVHLNGRKNDLCSLYSGNADRPLGTFNLSFFSKKSVASNLSKNR